MPANPVLLAPNTALAAGDPTPPATAHKTVAAILWGAVPAVIGVILGLLHEFASIWPDAPTWAVTLVAVVLAIATPIASAFGVYRAPNLLRQPVVVDPQPVVP